MAAKLSVVEMKKLVVEAEAANDDHITIDADVIGGNMERDRSDSGSNGGQRTKRSLARLTKDLTNLYREAISQTLDGKLGYQDIKYLVASFAGSEPNDSVMSKIMTELDADGDGDVTEEEWIMFGLKNMTGGNLEQLERDDDDHDEDKGLISGHSKKKRDMPVIQYLCYYWNQMDGTKMYNSSKAGVKKFLEESKVTVNFGDVMMFMTVWVLFADNIKLLLFEKTSDRFFEVCNTICLFAFISEFVAQTWSLTNWESWRPVRYTGYFLSFDFWLDFMSIISMLPDVEWIAGRVGLDNISNAIVGNNSVTKSGRIIRLVRLVRLVRLYKIYLDKKKKAQQARRSAQKLRSGDFTVDEIMSQEELYKERSSNLGLKLNQSITQRVIALILTMVFVVPLTTYTESNYAAVTGVDTLYTFVAPSQNTPEVIQNALVENFIDNMVTSKNNPRLVYLEVLPLYEDDPDPKVDLKEEREMLRSAAHTIIILGNKDTTPAHYVRAEFDNNELLKESARLNIGLTVFVGMMLLVGSAAFNNDAQVTVLAPIERMMNMVDAVVKNPLKVLQFDHSAAAGPGEYETRLLESTVEKITGLLRVGFGEAGAGIISSNLEVDTTGTSSGSKINPLLPGVRVYAIVGFCDIHHFEEVLSNLANDILAFVNTIAEIVHYNVTHWKGQCNKNLGNAFVILWRIDDEDRLYQALNTSKFNKKSGNTPEISRDERKSSGARVIDLKKVPGINILADQALIGYLKIIAEINRNRAILKYRNEPRLTNNGTESFQVSMGFGLHAGWAIEGAVGSMYKVDATYLSPHVNMAARLETSSRQYGVPLLMSHFVHELLSEQVKEKCRMLDVVTVKGSKVPVRVYTYDCLTEQVFKTRPAQAHARRDADARKLQKANEEDGNGKTLTADTILMKAHAAATQKENFMTAAPLDIDFAEGKYKSNQSSSEKSKVGKNMGNMRKTMIDEEEAGEGRFYNAEHDTLTVFDCDDDLLMLRAHIKENPEFVKIFDDGIQLYLKGDWIEASKKLSKADELMTRIAPQLGGDKPSRTLIDYMEARYCTAPADWGGFRPLTSK